MSTALAIWSTRIEPGKKSTIIARADIRITGAALDAKLADEKARSSVKLTFTNVHADDSDEDEEDASSSPAATTILCSLTPGTIEQSQLDLVINEDDAVEFEIIGKNAIYLTGNYISQPADFPADESDVYSDEEDEEDHDLRNVSSDVELDAAELDEAEIDSDQNDSHRFEEIKSEDEKETKESKKEEPSSPSSKKRPRESDAVEAGTGGEQKLSKRQQKKLNKKLKAENGQAVPNGAAKSEQKTGEKKEKEDKKEGVNKKKKAQTITTSSGLQVTDVKVGAGKAAKKGDKVSIRYVGRLKDGKVFDENMNRKPLTFKLGHGEVVKGWDEGIVGMQAGGERVLIIPPNLGYGSQRMGDQIPANSTLEFKCKLLEIKS